MAIVKFHTEKGNVSVKARNEIKGQVVDMLKTRLGSQLFVSPKGLAMEIATDERGEPIYMVIDPTITQTLDVKPVARKAKATVEVDVPNLF